MIASGFGVSDGGQRTGSLKTATIHMNSKQNCKDIYRSIYGKPFQGIKILIIIYDALNINYVIQTIISVVEMNKMYVKEIQADLLLPM